uniref:G_PROTEIN_RECEP_F1_2 domain-containing protein n=1 Tax=Parastrongyloides trichosuri TaxID=131310 RepID=A0A0N5A0N5_PARTI
MFVITPMILWILLIETNFVPKSEFVNRRVGQILLIGYFSNIYSRFVTSINRFVSIHLPFKYNKIFSNFNTYCILTTYWILSLLMCIPYSLGDECNFMFIEWIWSYADTQQCILFSTLEDFVFGVTFGSITIGIDFLLLCTLTFHKYFVYKDGKIVKANRKSTIFGASLKLDLHIFYRTMSSNLCLILMLISFHYIVDHVEESTILTFLSTTFVWMFYHSFDGVVVGLLSHEIINHILVRLGIRKKNVPTTRSVKTSVLKQNIKNKGTN